jgi:predicted DCC family thiol-disulfide oxidoreductase YuxK
VSAPLLLYDGDCGFCDGTVKFVLRHDRGGALRFATLQGDAGQAVRARHPELAGVDSVVWLDEMNGAERVAVRSEAALRLARYLGWPWRAALAARLIPRVLRDAAYDLFARHRYRFFGRADECALPSPEERKRFISSRS